MRWKNLNCRQCPSIAEEFVGTAIIAKVLHQFPRQSVWVRKFPVDYTVLHDGQVFLQYDFGVNDKNRFLIFASNQGLDSLVLNKQWACDGTFKCCPSILNFISCTLFMFVFEKYTFRDFLRCSPTKRSTRTICSLRNYYNSAQV